ncbi:MAG: type II secretion system protein GspE [Gammaproteobacteria bacterium]|nr:MAG: type II secretion system protein GspE [Gammaproteobacteria bacterium]
MSGDGDLIMTEVDDATGRRPPYGFCKRHGVMIENDADHPRLLVLNPPPAEVLLELQRFVGGPMEMAQVDEEEFNRRLARVYSEDENGASSMMQDLGEELDLEHAAEALAEPEDLLESQDDAPIIRLINALLTQAIKENASDIHIEPFENRLVIRFRVDGVLREVLEPPRKLAPLIVSRIKVMARLDIAEKRLPQDGRISLKVAGHPVDVRVSSLPSGHGERIVLRLLDKQAGRLDLGQLGLSRHNFEVLDRVIHKPHGIILVTGPTGSGKTTTLYAALQRINDRSRNILTVEDPIEYFLDGIGQTQVNPKVDMSFARGLRAILRQDPDVVMVGEIRDLETAQISIQASLTGHLVLSTLHTNTAAGAITRLRDMGVEPYLLSSTLLAVLAQRLVRVLCPYCKKAAPASEQECLELGVGPADPPLIHHAVGCPQCNQLGYHGRTGIHEIIEVDEAMRPLIHDGMSELELERLARSQGPSIRQDGMQKVLQGITTMEEVLRVTRED